MEYKWLSPCAGSHPSFASLRDNVVRINNTVRKKPLTYFSKERAAERPPKGLCGCAVEYHINIRQTGRQIRPHSVVGFIPFLRKELIKERKKNFQTYL